MFAELEIAGSTEWIELERIAIEAGHLVLYEWPHTPEPWDAPMARAVGFAVEDPHIFRIPLALVLSFTTRPEE